MCARACFSFVWVNTMHVRERWKARARKEPVDDGQSELEM